MLAAGWVGAGAFGDVHAVRSWREIQEFRGEAHRIWEEYEVIIAAISRLSSLSSSISAVVFVGELSQVVFLNLGLCERCKAVGTAL